ncbi:sugar ABC transporter ATP-binding protein [Spirochaeta dissipatitropha]
MNPCLELENISWRGPSGFSLHDINMNLFPGEVHILVGENGSGKSSLMKLIAGYHRPDSGSIKVNGSPVDFSGFHQATQSGIVYQHQDIQLFDNLTVAENVCLPIQHRWYSVSRTYLYCIELFQRIGVDLDPDSLVGDLGYAERQLTAMARTIAADPQIVIFDEPSSAMSDTEREVLFDAVKTLRSQEIGIMYISHRLDEVQTIGDRVSVMHQGRLVTTCSAHKVAREEFIGLMTGGQVKHMYPRTCPEPGGEVLRVQDLCSKPALENISFSLRRGEILGITGLMGSGRTRLAHCLVGAQPVDTGTVTVNSKLLRLTDPGEALAHGLVLVPEDRITEAIFPHADLSLNMTIASLKRFVDRWGIDTNSLREMTSEYSRRMAIRPGMPDDLVGSYSGGNQQKSVLARAFMRRGLIYLLDEPTRGVDAAAKIDIYNAMNDLVAKGASIILFSSEIDEIIGMADRILVLSGGQIAGEFSKAEASKEAILSLATNE